MQRYEPLEDGVYENIKRALNILTIVVSVFGLLIISIAVAVNNVHHNPSSLFNYSGYDPVPNIFVDRCLPMRPLLAEECETYYISENSTWRNDDDGMCSQYFLKPGDICEGDGECHTNDELNNCGDGLDIYLITPLRERP